MKVLIADDTALIRKYLSDILEQEGYETLIAENGVNALKLFHQQNPDFLCLDVMMPEMTGYDVCREIRKHNETIPILMLSSKAEPFDKALGIELGADDYVAKPFDARELMARIRAITRRCMAQHDKVKTDDSFFMGDVEIYPNQLRANVNGKMIDLSLREVKILKLLYEKQSSVVTRDDLLDHCWGEHITTESRTIDFHISKLRKRIEKNSQQPQIIKTVHGVGYRFDKEA